MTSSEEWRAIPGYAGAYEVSSLGRVRSVDRRVPGGHGGTRSCRGRLLIPQGRGGYMQIGLRISHAARNTVSVHRLVASAFIGPCPSGMEVLHSNGECDDNRLENLRYGTRGENVEDTIRHGHHPWAGHSHCPNGHEYTPENTTVAQGNKGRAKRRCLTCYRATQARYAAKRKAARRANSHS